MVKAVTAIEIHIVATEEWDVNMLDIKIKGSKVIFKNQFLCHNKNEFIEKIIPGKPVCLCVTGKGILSKKVEPTEKPNTDNYISMVLPNADPKDFHIHSIHAGKNACNLSIVRGSLIDEILNVFSEANVPVIDLHFGEHVLKSIFEYSGQPLTDILIGDKQYFINEENNLQSKDNTGRLQDSQEINIFGQQIQESQIIAVASGLFFLIEQQGRTYSEPERVLTAWKNNYHGILFKKLGLGALITFLALLIINFLIYDYYNSMLADLSIKGKQVEVQIKQYDELKSQLRQKQDLLKEFGLGSSSGLSFYIDQTAASLYPGIRLTEMEINPRQQRLRNRDITYDLGLIKIQGKTSTAGQLNEWVKILRKMEWVDKVTIEEYSQQNFEHEGDFNLLLKFIF